MVEIVKCWEVVAIPVPVSKVEIIVNERGVFLLACRSYHFIRFLPSFIVLVVDRW